MLEPPDTSSSRILVQALRELSASHHIKFNGFSRDWIIHLSKGDEARHVYGYNFDLNTASAAMIAADKAGLCHLLALAGLPHVEHLFFPHPKETGYVFASGNWEEMSRYARSLNYDLVCKTNQGSGGTHVYRVFDQRELEEAVHLLFQLQRGLSLSPFYEIDHEFRLIMLNGRALLAYEKMLPVEEGNEDAPFRKHNLGLGAHPRLLGPDESAPLLRLAAEAMEAAKLSLASVDVISTAGELKILEINCGIMLENFARHRAGGYERAKEVYASILEAMFPFAW